ncbi:PAS domain-containing sensor histidine kinase [Ferruginivarius sediminum]|uniref:sensor histidine kinase n=1 Tax=Ferruginivarius sediminum TaxID=2661937 RepID=UPI001379F988|nr:PAS domain-containing sensor histidine kinase [Ferruginivarius sediminum]
MEIVAMIPAGKTDHDEAAFASGREGRYEDLLRATADFVWDTDDELRLTHVSTPIARHLGLPPQYFIGRPLTELGRFEDSQGDDSGAGLRARRAFRGARFVMRDAMGRDVAFHLNGVPFYNPDTGAYAGYRGTAVRDAQREVGGGEDSPKPSDDVTRELLQTLEEVLLRHNDLRWRLQRSHDADQTSQERLARLLHELRTPLNAVAGYAQLARQHVEATGGDETLRSYLGNVAEAAQHMIRLISGIEDDNGSKAPQSPAGSATKATAASPVRHVADLAQVVRDAKAMTELSARRAGVRFVAMEPHDSVTVYGERKALTQILVNLLGNAVKFTPSGGEVGVSMDGSGGDTVRLAVTDTGPGIPAEEQERIFESQYRMPCHNGNDGPKGDGLGLTIARKLARESGGDLTVYSTPGEGTVFYLDLKVAEASNVA